MTDVTLDYVKKEFRCFLHLIWRHLQLPEPTVVQRDIAMCLQEEIKRLIIQGYRGVGKSFITSAYVLWRLLNNPQIKVLVVSASKERADAFSLFTKKLICEVPLLRHLKPREDQRKSNMSYDVAPALPDHSPSVKSVGIMGQIVGSRADLIVADDIETPTNCATQVMRDKLAELVKEFDAIIKPLPTSRIIYLGTPHVATSLYNTLLDRGFLTRIWTVMYPSEPDIYSGNLADITNDLTRIGQPTDPYRFDDTEIYERKLSYGTSGFALQFMLDTTLSDASKSPLKVQDLIVMSLSNELAHTKLAWASSPELVINDVPNLAYNKDSFYLPMWHSDKMTEYKGSVMAIDPAGRGNDETGYSVVKQLNGNLFVLACGGLAGGYDTETLEELVAIAKKYKVNEVVIEANFGDGMYTQLLTPVMIKQHKCAVTEVKHHRQKELRIIDTLEPVLSSHRLVIDKSIIQKDYDSAKDSSYSLIYQLTRITRERNSIKHDDRLDSLAIAVNYWVEAMAQDQVKADVNYNNKLLDQELKQFKKHVFSIKYDNTADRSWCA